ncbi:hypothetical protein LXA43DRAFT_1137612 [Ganoderma leucocontextum]|nr:hypothetical protein LXA43DRAFT_1137612 [Ganoderma leucocontextum]
MLLPWIAADSPVTDLSHSQRPICVHKATLPWDKGTHIGCDARAEESYFLAERASLGFDHRTDREPFEDETDQSGKNTSSRVRLRTSRPPTWFNSNLLREALIVSGTLGILARPSIPLTTKFGGPSACAFMRAAEVAGTRVHGVNEAGDSGEEYFKIYFLAEAKLRTAKRRFQAFRPRPYSHGRPLPSGQRSACASRTSSGRLRAGTSTPAPPSSTHAPVSRRCKSELTCSMCHFVSLLAAPQSRLTWMMATSTNDFPLDLDLPDGNTAVPLHEPTHEWGVDRRLGVVEHAVLRELVSPDDLLDLDVLDAGAVLLVLDGQFSRVPSVTRRISEVHTGKAGATYEDELAADVGGCHVCGSGRVVEFLGNTRGMSSSPTLQSSCVLAASASGQTVVQDVRAVLTGHLGSVRLVKCCAEEAFYRPCSRVAQIC